MPLYSRAALGLAATASLLALSAGAHAAEPDLKGRCLALEKTMAGHWPDAGTRIVSSTLQAAGPITLPPMMPGAPGTPVQLPEHCEVYGVMHERTGVDGQAYAIRFHVRLPTAWNQGFFFQGGGGTNGEVGNAIGPTGSDTPPALVQGYAVVSQDSGHDNARNSDPTHGGTAAFGFDPQARADYGNASLKPVADAAKALVAAFYGSGPHRSYFVGCSKGGEEGMVFAQQHPEEFDGILASAPGFALPRAALAQAWDTQAFAPLAKGPDGQPSFPLLSAAFSDADLGLVRDAVLEACDADDGAKDGIVGTFAQCTAAKVAPALKSRTCAGAKADGCLSANQITAITQSYGGPRTKAGQAIYIDWPWDAGVAAPGWRIWKLGLADKVPSLNVALGGASLASVFTTPPTPLPPDPQALLRWQMGLDIDQVAAQLTATSAAFPRSAWQDVSAHSPDLSGLKARGAKLMVPHGASDPVFSINDTLAWWREVDGREGGKAAAFVRVFPVPGMNHCAGGPATAHYDAFSALVRWVEQGQAPDRILASAGPDTPWPGRTRPLCPYPKVARYKGTGDLNSADSFDCAL
ncbi:MULTISPECIES: tannase/feruloyl esterase family alpha/beta hydrolase [Nitrospirillum]|uniref:Feruloyl esterase n=1 Tax=Nitrospirillum amazonense TaxID=28077 RepID=A0A560GDQ8_9PROT|nr:tannase/feruloyl esterase family alpha/beta hydrolase [Nitrospirillum amazonense]MEC4592275.1 tannase/feruloyl esterase family alpha/beta hydrolase [Nitrospirillum amazonense]TWB31941.1 feruloyl esterase [Nitrospirillum amazonense]